MGTRRINRRKLRASDVTFVVLTEEEDLEPDFDDPEMVREIKESYNSGNGLAWCYVIVEAHWEDKDGTRHKGRDTLGGVSCLPTEDKTARQNFDALVKEHGMFEEALADLQREVNAHDRRKARDAVMLAIADMPDTVFEHWSKRAAFAPLADAVLAMRKIPE